MSAKFDVKSQMFATFRGQNQIKPIDQENKVTAWNYEYVQIYIVSIQFSYSLAPQVRSH